MIERFERTYTHLKLEFPWFFRDYWHFPEENRREGLFAGYVNTWLKLKQKSARWPAGVETEEQKAAYIRDYKQHEGIDLDPEKIAVSNKAIIADFHSGIIGEENDMIVYRQQI